MKNTKMFLFLATAGMIGLCSNMSAGLPLPDASIQVPSDAQDGGDKRAIHLAEGLRWIASQCARISTQEMKRQVDVFMQEDFTPNQVRDALALTDDNGNSAKQIADDLFGKVSCESCKEFSKGFVQLQEVAIFLIEHGAGELSGSEIKKNAKLQKALDKKFTNSAQ